MFSRTLHRLAGRRDGLRLAGQEGFTLLELLVAILILTILTTIALATFLSQRSDALDTGAKSAARVARIALEINHQQTGTYAADAAALQAIESSLVDARNLQVSGTPTTYTVSVDSPSGAKGGGKFTITRAANGVVTRTCANPGRGGCKSAPDAAGNLW